MTTSAAIFIRDGRGIQTFGKDPARALARFHADFRPFFAHGAKWHGDSVLRTCQQRIRSVRFARYSAQELTAASESLLFGTVGDIDQRIPGNWATRRWRRNKSAGASSAATKAAPSW
jgi:hypothetical protein